MRFHVLGPFEVTGEGGDPLPIAGSKERTILAYLVARAGHVVSVDELVDELWGETPPRTAEKTLGSHVSRLRGTLEPDRAAGSASEVILTRGDGYALAVDPDAIDAVRFEHLAAEGRQLVEVGRFEDGSARLEEALELWRGTAYQGLRYTRFGSSEGERLDELRRSSIDDRIDAKLATGEGTQLVAELEGGVREEPLRERRWGQLMLALYRGGRQAEALGAFTRARSVLVDELGIEPGPALKRLQAAILEQDPALDTGWRVTPDGAPRVADVCPYKGLARFESADAGFFFGRERSVAEAIARIVSGHFLALVGPSGSGKSSLMRAGILHALESGALPGSAAWTYSLIRPGQHPLGALSGALLGSDGDRSPERIRRAMVDVGGKDRSVLAIDQFEEVFTLCTDAAERGTFLDLIADAALASDGSVTVLLAIRADYYGRCAEHRALASLLENSQTLVGPMTNDELKRAIELPAERASLEVDPELTNALVGDVVGRAGGLPLLSTALLELWTRRRGRSLVLDEYLRSGGVEGAVGRLAEDAFTHLDGKGRAAARRILMRLAEWGEGGEIVGRRTSLDEFDLGHDEDISRAMDALVAARLISAAEGSVEVAHEALLREWPRLREWFEADAEGRRIHRRITDSARSWAEEGRDEAGLLRGARLGAALEWTDMHAAEPNELEREFLGRSRTASEGEVARTRRTNRLLRGLLAGVALLLASSLVVGSLAIAQRNDAREVAAVADARRLASRSLVEEDAGLALVLAREAVHIYDSPETRSALFSTLIRTPAIVGRMYASGGPSPFGDQEQWIEISPDGDTIAIGDSGPSVAFFDADERTMLGAIPIESGTTRATFSPDGETLTMVTPANDTLSSEIVAVDIPSLTERARAESRGLAIDAIEYMDGGTTVLSAELFADGAFLIPRDPGTLEPSGPRIRAHDLRVAGMATSSDGRWLVTTSVDSDDATGIPPGSGETTLWDAGSLRPIRSFEESADDSPLDAASTDVALSPDGSVAALIDNRFRAIPEEGSIAFLDLRSGAVRQGQGGHQGAGGTQWETTGVAFTPDGRSVVTTGNDSHALIWDVRSAAVRESLFAGADQQIRGPALSADGTTLYTTDRTREVILWDLIGARGLARPFDAGEGCAGWPYFAITRDGRRLAVMQCRDPGRSNGSVELIDTSDLTSIREIQYPGSVPQGVAFSPDGRMLAVGSWTWDGNRGHVRLWDPESGRPVGPDLPGISSGVAVWTLEFSPDGSTLAGGAQVGDDQTGRIQFWDVITRTPLEATLDLPTPVNDLTSTPDGSSLVAVTAIAEGGDIVYWDWASGSVRETIHADDLGVWSSDISNDGRILATGGQGSSVRLWDVASGDAVGLPLSGLEGFAAVVDVSSDGRTVLAASTIGEVLMWDASSGTILASFPGVELGTYAAAAFSPDGRSVIIVSDVGSGWVWDVEPSSWADRACDISGRSLTRAEWHHFLPTLPYHATCGS